MDLQATTLGASEREEAASVVACRRERVGRIGPVRLAFIDERGSTVGLVPLRAGAPSGGRALREVYACGEHAAYRPG